MSVTTYTQAADGTADGTADGIQQTVQWTVWQTTQQTVQTAEHRMHTSRKKDSTIY